VSLVYTLVVTFFFGCVFVVTHPRCNLLSKTSERCFENIFPITCGFLMYQSLIRLGEDWESLVTLTKRNTCSRVVTRQGVVVFYHFKKTSVWSILIGRPYHGHTLIVISRHTLTRVMLNEGIINWMMRWWSGQVNGRFAPTPTIQSTHAQMLLYKHILVHQDDTRGRILT
jgi:hypothetical protein